MRKICMLLLLLPLSICAASWQAFEEGQKLPDGMQWAIFSYVHPQYYYTEIYRIAGDSVIDGKVFKKVLTSRNEDFSNATLERYMLRNEGSRIYLRWHSGKEDLFFDCNSEVGDTLILQGGNPAIITSVKDTVFDNVKGDKLKCWEMILGEYDSNNEAWDFWWEAKYIENVGFLSTGHAQTHFLQTGGGNELLYVSVGDSLIYLCEEGIYYKSSETAIDGISAEKLFIAQANGECIVTLPTVAKWSATLYNSNGVAVVRKAGEGGEIILPAESKGIHILVLNIDGKEYTKKVMIK